MSPENLSRRAILAGVAAAAIASPAIAGPVVTSPTPTPIGPQPGQTLIARLLE